ncbi:hypothetical protein CN463_18085 [Bacillus cereus]|uniref:hypothetical protein n=1 Tax=Bacillus cereus TaxID=1396 RepID=UPI000BF50733|nr:hypothetical protein [Bacillus cereus]PEX60638.1 hypothetical protein CN463_18085 [Bacillus cereus]
MDIARFTTYYNNKMKNNLTKAKRIKTIAEYFQKKSQGSLSFANEKECYLYILEYIRSWEDEAEEILEEIYMLLEYEYSTQNPNYVFDLKTSKKHEEFNKFILKIFKKTIEFGDFEYNLTNSIRYDRINKIIECDLDYKEYGIDIVKGEKYKKRSGFISVTFDVKNEKFISSQSKNYKCHNNLVKFFNTKGIKISPIYILKRALTLKKKNCTEFSPTTLIIINLLYKDIPKMGYKVNLDAISFTNLDSQNVQGMKMKGTNLLKAEEILQRIHLGDDVHTLKLTLEIIRDNNGNQQYFATTFTLDLRGKIVFIFNEDEIRENRKREICIGLQESLMKLIYDEDTITRGQDIIHKELPKPKSIHQIVAEIQQDLMKLVGDTNDRIKVEKYFIENYSHSVSFNS